MAPRRDFSVATCPWTISAWPRTGHEGGGRPSAPGVARVRSSRLGRSMTYREPDAERVAAVRAAEEAEGAELARVASAVRRLVEVALPRDRHCQRHAPRRVESPLLPALLPPGRPRRSRCPEASAERRRTTRAIAPSTSDRRRRQRCRGRPATSTIPRRRSRARPVARARRPSPSATRSTTSPRSQGVSASPAPMTRRVARGSFPSSVRATAARRRAAPTARARRAGRRSPSGSRVASAPTAAPTPAATRSPVTAT